MDPLVSALTALITGGFTVTGVFITIRHAGRQQARVRQAAAADKLESVVVEAVDATSELMIALAQHRPRWNAWQPRLLMTGQVLAELAAGHEAGTPMRGVVHASRLVVEWNTRSFAAAEEITVPLRRVLAALARTTLLPDQDIAEAALRLGDAVAAAATTHGADSRFHPMSTAAARERAEAVLHTALADLVSVVQQRLHPRPASAMRWRRLGGWVLPSRRRRTAAVGTLTQAREEYDRRSR